MNINGAIDPSNTLAQSGAVGNHRHRPDMTKMMTGVADLLGTNVDDLRTQLTSGKTLDQLATDKGVSHDDLIKAISSGLAAGKPEGAPALDATQLTTMAEAVASGKRPPRPSQGGNDHDGHGAGFTGNGRDFSAIGVNSANGGSSLADLLGLTQDALTTSLQSGSTIEAIATQQGVSQQQLGTLLIKGVYADTPL